MNRADRGAILVGRPVGEGPSESTRNGRGATRRQAAIMSEFQERASN